MGQQNSAGMDRYEKGVQLGKGTFATVYKGRDKQVSVAAAQRAAAAAVAACGASLCLVAMLLL